MVISVLLGANLCVKILHMVPLDTNQKESRLRVPGAVQPGLLQAGGARFPWSATQLGEGNSDNKPTGSRESSVFVATHLGDENWI